MSDLPCVTGAEAVSVFETFGFGVVRTTGSHKIMKRPGHQFNLSVPVHGNKNIKPGTLRSLISAAGITVEQFKRAMK